MQERQLDQRAHNLQSARNAPAGTGVDMSCTECDPGGDYRATEVERVGKIGESSTVSGISKLGQQHRGSSLRRDAEISHNETSDHLLMGQPCQPKNEF